MHTSIAELDSGFVPHPLPTTKTSNPTSDSRRKHAAIASATTIIAVILTAALVFHGYVAWMLAYPYVAQLTSNPKLAIGLDYDTVTFPSKSGRTMVSGWFVPAGAASDDALTSQSYRTVIFSHGYGANREESWVPMYELTRLLNGLHYNVLLFDYGYASKEYKAPATGGLEESQQLLAAIEYAKSRGSEDVIVWGFSMGAGTALQAALQTDLIDAMILDSLFVPSSDGLFNNLQQFVSLPRFPSLPLIEAILPLWTGTKFGGIPAEQAINTTYNIPLYIVHGTSDTKAAFQTAETIAAGQSNPPSREWIVPEGKHELIFQVHPQEYIQRAALFLSQVDQMLRQERAA